MTRNMVAALYIDPLGPYPQIVADWYDAERDARTYCGPHPVIAHPPCGPWGKMSHLCTMQDPALGPLGVEQVRRWGGVLEHPAGSALWRHCGIPAPFRRVPMIAPHEWSLAVEQVRWGHPCQKLTWLLFVGVNPMTLGPIPPPRRATHVIDDHGPGDAARRGLKHLPKRLRHITPPDFALWLARAAEGARPRHEPAP